MNPIYNDISNINCENKFLSTHLNSVKTVFTGLETM